MASYLHKTWIGKVAATNYREMNREIGSRRDLNLRPLVDDSSDINVKVPTFLKALVIMLT